MNNPRTKRLPKILLGQFSVAALIVIIASFLVIYSLGYKINLTSRKIIKTGLIVLSVNPLPDKITVNGKDVAAKEDVAIPLEAGNYDVRVYKDGYQEWNVRSEVKAELVNYYKYIELFKSNVQLVETSDSTVVSALNSPSSVLAVNAPKGLSNNDYEIWIQQKLVTRFSTPISQVAWFPDNHHIIFLRDNAVHIIDEAGNNDKTLVELPGSENSRFLLVDKGQKIYVLSGGKYYTAIIQ